MKWLKNITQRLTPNWLNRDELDAVLVGGRLDGKLLGNYTDPQYREPIGTYEKTKQTVRKGKTLYRAYQYREPQTETIKLTPNQPRPKMVALVNGPNRGDTALTSETSLKKSSSPVLTPKARAPGITQPKLSGYAEATYTETDKVVNRDGEEMTVFEYAGTDEWIIDFSRPILTYREVPKILTPKPPTPNGDGPEWA